MADAAAELDEGGIKRTLKDLFAGAAGGVAQVLLGQSCMVAFDAHSAFLLRFLVFHPMICYNIWKTRQEISFLLLLILGAEGKTTS